MKDIWYRQLNLILMEWSNLSFIISNSQFIMDLKVLEPFRTYISIALLQNRGGFHFPLSPHNLSSYGELLHNYLISLPHSFISCWWRKKYSEWREDNKWDGRKYDFKKNTRARPKFKLIEKEEIKQQSCTRYFSLFALYHYSLCNKIIQTTCTY